MKRKKGGEKIQRKKNAKKKNVMKNAENLLSDATKKIVWVESLSVIKNERIIESWKWLENFFNKRKLGRLGWENRSVLQIFLH